MSAIPPSAYNLLELYRQHRDEIDAITDPTSLFILAFTNRQNAVRLDELAGDLGLAPKVLRAKFTPLLRAQLAVESSNQLTITPLGKRVLDELGFLNPPIPTDLPERGEPPRKPPSPPATSGTPGWLWSVIAFFATAAVVLIVAIIIGSTILPGIVNPPVPTLVPIPTITPIPPRPDVQIEFVADRTRLEPGECTILRWQVVGGFGVTLNNQTVNRTGETRVCPKESTTYELAADAGESMKRSAIAIAVAPVVLPEPTRTFTPPPSRTTTLTPTVTRTSTPSPAPPGRIAGAVMRAADQKAIPGARIQISGGQATTSLDGSYGFSGLMPGTFSVTASATGYDAKTQTVTVTSGGTIRADFQLIKTMTTKGEATLRPWDCFNLDYPGEYFAAPSNPEFFTCPSRADIQWVANKIKLLNQAGIAPASPPYTYEGCIVQSSIVGDLSPVLNKYYCVSTSTDQTAVIQFTKIDSSNRITFFWWLY